MTDYPLATIQPDKIAVANDLHRQCTGLADRVQALGQRMWQTAVVLGYTLVQIKAELPHGAYTKLFKGKTPTCGRFDFAQSTAKRYVALYKSVEARVRKLGGDQAAAMRQLIEQGAADELALMLGDVSRASSLREAYIEMGIIAAPKTPQEAMFANRNTAGRPKGSIKPPSPWDEERKLAVHRAAELAAGLTEFVNQGCLGYLRADEVEGLLVSLAHAVNEAKACRAKSRA